MSLAVIATAVPLPDRRDEVIAVFEDIIPRVHAEDGCLLYALHEDEDRLVLIEKWADAEALGAHSRGPLLAELLDRTHGRLVRELEVRIMRPHPGGTEAQGTL